MDPNPNGQDQNEAGGFNQFSMPCILGLSQNDRKQKKRQKPNNVQTDNERESESEVEDPMSKISVPPLFSHIVSGVAPSLSAESRRQEKARKEREKREKHAQDKVLVVEESSSRVEASSLLL